MILRLAWLVVLCASMTRAIDSHPCPCIPKHLCPRVFGGSPVDEKVTGPMKPCLEPETVHCCGTSVSLQEHLPIHIVVAEELKKEEQLMAVVNNAIERMSEQYAGEDIQRDDKSIDITKKNYFGCNTKQCNNSIAEEKSRPLNEMKTSHSSIAPGQNNFFNSSNTKFSRPQLSEVITGNGTVEKVYIVYAENINNNNAYLGKESKAQIVLPTSEMKKETLPFGERITEENENEPQESSIDQIQVNTRIKETPDDFLTQTKSKLSRFQNKNRFQDRKSNRLKKLFPKRRPRPHVHSKSAQYDDENQQRGYDAEIAESNLDEVRDKTTFEDHGVVEDYPDDEDSYDDEDFPYEEIPNEASQPPSPTNSQNKSEQTESRRVPLPPRRLTPQQQKPEENKQTTKNALELLRSRTKSRNDPTVYKANDESMKTAQDEPERVGIAMEMDKINIKVINDMMKTNFTSRSTLRSNTGLKSSRVPLRTSNNQLASLSNRNNQEQNTTESTSLPRRPANQNTQHLQHKPQTSTSSLTNQNHEQITNHGTGSSEVNKVHRFQLKPRPLLRTQNPKLPPKIASTISMVQEQAFDTSRNKTNAQVQARKQPFMRIRPRTQVTTKNTADSSKAPQSSQSSEEQVKPTTSSPLFVRKRLPTRERLLPRLENINKNKQTEEHMVTTSPETFKTTSKNRPGTTNEEDATAQDDEPISTPLKSEPDLDGSGSTFDFQQYTPRDSGRFVAPRELETGFRPMPPMMESRELKIVGPLPGGFIDPASGFSEGDNIGLELPHPNFQNQYNNERNLNQNNGPLTLLPPVILPQPEGTASSQFLPKFPEAGTQKFFEPEETTQFEQGGDLTQIQNQFGTLKSQYDTLLKRYAETLSIYIGQYKKLINSSPPSVR